MMFICIQSVSNIGGEFLPYDLYSEGKLYTGNYYISYHDKQQKELHLLDNLGDIRIVNMLKFKQLDEWRDQKIEQIIA